MSREIKFRAWDKYNKGMKYGNFIPVEGEDNHHSIVQGIIHKVDIHPQQDVNIYFAFRKYIMQYTGLLDKNGKEIYEGDIVSVKEDNAVCVVKFENGEYVRDWGKFTMPLNQETQLWEIIGNIYENPELI